jgi:predicted acetyltransferase
MGQEDFRLIEPGVQYKAEFLSLAEEFKKEGGKVRQYDQALEYFDKYVQSRHDHKKGVNLPEGWVPESTFWLIRDDNVILGTSSVRHELTEQLRRIGGHIGYNIRPSERRKGYGTAILALTLRKARQLGLKRVLVTCDEDNIASAKIIERNGGTLEDRYLDDELEQPKRRYWIELRRIK